LARQPDPISGLRLLLFTSGFGTYNVLHEEVVSPSPNPNLEDQVSVLVAPGEGAAQLETTGASLNLLTIL